MWKMYLGHWLDVSVTLLCWSRLSKIGDLEKFLHPGTEAKSNDAVKSEGFARRDIEWTGKISKEEKNSIVNYINSLVKAKED